MSKDRTIDDSLRSVPVPERLEEKLSPAALFDDVAIDRILAGVTVPVGLNERIHRAARRGPTADATGVIDLSRFSSSAATRPLPSTPPVGRPERRIILRGLVRDIASVATALGLVGALAWAGIEFSRHIEGVPSDPRTITRLDFDDPVDPSVSERPLRVAVPEGGWPMNDFKNPPSAAASTAGLAEASRDEANPPAAVAQPDDLAPASSAVPRALADSRTHDNATSVRGAAILNQSAAGTAVSPSLATVEIPANVRRRVPRTRGYDLSFEMTTGEQPFVDPGADPALAFDRPPLTLRVDGFEVLTSANSGRRPRIRSEEVIAAVPARPQSKWDATPLKLSIHEVPGLRAVGGVGSLLVEFNVSARPIRGAADSAEPLSVTLVLDQSGAGDPAVWRRICRALGDLAAQLSPPDRVNVVLAGPKARMAVQDADPAQLATLAADLEWQGAAAACDLDGGLLLAHPASRVIVLAHAVTLENGGTRVRESLSAWHNALSSVGGDSLACQPAGGARFIVLDPSTPSPTAWKESTFGRTSPDAVSIRRALIGQATGRETLVASQCEMEVRFDPQRVARYRLIGHRQSAIESLAATPPRGTDLHAGETVRVVYEVVPRSSDILNGLASAVLSWRSGQGVAQRIEASPKRTGSDPEASLFSVSDRELVLAAGLGEVASGSVHIGRGPAMVTALERLVGEWRIRGEMSPFIEALARSLEHVPGAHSDR